MYVIPQSENLHSNILILRLTEHLQPNVLYQQDIAAPRWTSSVFELLNRIFSNNGLVVGVPYRELEITSLDFFLWDYIKNMIYQTCFCFPYVSHVQQALKFLMYLLKRNDLISNPHSYTTNVKKHLKGCRLQIFSIMSTALLVQKNVDSTFFVTLIELTCRYIRGTVQKLLDFFILLQKLHFISPISAFVINIYNNKDLSRTCCLTDAESSEDHTLNSLLQTFSLRMTGRNF